MTDKDGVIFEVIEEALAEGKSIGQVRFYGLDVDDNQIILDGVIYDEESGWWVDAIDRMEYSEDWKRAFVNYGARVLTDKKITCRFALYGDIKKDGSWLAYQLDPEQIKEVLECYGYVVRRLTDLDKNKEKQKW